jgi:hypothetical protein
LGDIGNVADTPLNPEPSPKNEPEKDPDRFDPAPVEIILLEPKLGVVNYGRCKSLISKSLSTC